MRQAGSREAVVGRELPDEIEVGGGTGRKAGTGRSQAARSVAASAIRAASSSPSTRSIEPAAGQPRSAATPAIFCSRGITTGTAVPVSTVWTMKW
jgi:hypothetical protein